MKIKINISVDEKIAEKGKKKAADKGLSFSAYITTLIAKDTEKKSSGLFDSITEL